MLQTLGWSRALQAVVRLVKLLCVFLSLPVCVAGATAHLAPTLDDRRTLAKAIIVISMQRGGHYRPLQPRRQTGTSTVLICSI